ncbi:hypothetical protein BDV26DRAFT_270004 [Aspergillus bertholletiae]|uniref:Uncharacterized protein n=1 Tax=Aspergillus bertholletiae TaxID=1226010 RepID=A0A5N7AX48_9EURO|nr:hypothetical protein BDV26DRAFT_270004 [Aspergillus bertholletiae]
MNGDFLLPMWISFFLFFFSFRSFFFFLLFVSFFLPCIFLFYFGGKQRKGCSLSFRSVLFSFLPFCGWNLVGIIFEPSC